MASAFPSAIAPAALFAIACLTGCAARAATPAEAGAAALPSGDRGGELAVALIGLPNTLNSALTASPLTTMPAAQVFASLFLLDAGYRPRPYLAKRWHLSDDRLTLTVELVEGARFHDGRPVTSRDVAFSIRAVREHHSFTTMLADVERVETPDARTAVIRLSHPQPALFIALSAPLTPILPAHVYGDGRPLREHPANRAPIGSGPFRFVAWEPDGRIVLERFDDFFLPGRPYLDRLVFDVYPDSRQIPFALAAGEVHLAPFLSAFIGAEVVADTPELVSLREGQGGVDLPISGLAFNLRRPPFDDRRVRQAIAFAIDMDHLYSTLLAGDFLQASGPFPRGHPFASDAMQRYGVDVQRANRLLDEAGFPRGEDGRRFSVEFRYVHGDPILQPFAEYLRWELRRKLGIDVVLAAAVGFPEWLERVGAGDFDFILDVRLLWGDPLMGVHRIYHSDAIRPGGIFVNYAGYRNPEVDTLLEAAGREPHPSRRKALYARFQDIVAEDLPYLWLSNTPLHTIVHRDLVFPTDSPWAAVQPYDEVHWRREGAGPGGVSSGR